MTRDIRIKFERGFHFRESFLFSSLVGRQVRVPLMCCSASATPSVGSCTAVSNTRTALKSAVSAARNEIFRLPQRWDDTFFSTVNSGVPNPQVRASAGAPTKTARWTDNSTRRRLSLTDGLSTRRMRCSSVIARSFGRSLLRAIFQLPTNLWRGCTCRILFIGGVKAPSSTGLFDGTSSRSTTSC